MRRIDPIIMLTALGALLALVTGCVPQQSAHPEVVVVRETRNESVADVLSYANGVLGLAPADQAAARTSLARQFQLTQFPEDRMRLALLDTLLPPPVRDDAEASTLLSGYNWSVEGPGFKGLAGALMQVLDDRKSQAKARADVAQQRARLEQQLAAERAEKNHLQQQLDALERIEKTVNNRVNPIVPAPAATHRAMPPPTATHPAAAAATSQGA